MTEVSKRSRDTLLRIASIVYVLFLSLSICLGVAVFVIFDFNYSLLLAYTMGFFTLPVLGITFLVILVKAFIKHGLVQGIKESSLYVFGLLIGFAIIWSSREVGYDSKNKVNITFINHSDTVVNRVSLTGRHTNISFNTLHADSDTTLVFNAKFIDYKTDNSLENCIWLHYYMDEDWHKKLMVQKWSPMNDEHQIIFYNVDSVVLR